MTDSPPSRTETNVRIRIRAATPEDAPSIADVHAESVRGLGADAYDDRQVRAWLANVHPERYPIGESGFRVLVAEVDGAVTDGDGDLVGFGLLDCDPAGHDDATGEIGAVYIHPDNAREGIGTAILARLEDAARDAGLERLVLTASRNAIGFYECEGYEGVETVELEMGDDVELACLRMRTRLSGE